MFRTLPSSAAASAAGYVAVLLASVEVESAAGAADELAAPPPQPASKVAAIAVAVNKLIAFFIMCFPPFKKELMYESDIVTRILAGLNLWIGDINGLPFQ